MSLWGYTLPAVLPVNPHDHSREGDAIVRELQRGELLRKHPHRLFELLAGAPPQHTNALARLLGPLFCDPITQTKEVRLLHDWLSQDITAEELVRELFADQAEEDKFNRAAYAAECANDY